MIGLGLVAHAWGLIALAVAVHAAWPNPVTWVAAVMIVGTRQLGLAILMHEAAHGGLVANQRLNDGIGHWLCAAPVGASLALYRPYHLAHHKFTQQPNDPDLGLAAHFPISRASFWRKAVRDLTGQTYVKQRIGPILRPILRLARTPSAQGPAIVGVGGALRDHLVAQAIVFALFWAAGQPLAFLTIWLVAQATWLPFVTRVRNIAEHACVTDDASNPWRLARTTRARWWERLLIAPYWVHFHGEHHLWMHVPCYRLEEAHALLRAKGRTAGMVTSDSYVEVMRLATSKA
jgi:fatty acid desaturase